MKTTHSRPRRPRAERPARPPEAHRSSLPGLLAAGIAGLAIAGLASCASDSGYLPGGASPTASGPGGLTLTSPAFANGASIPRKYSCDDRETSIPLQWTDPPAGATTFALIMDDPDAPSGTWVHWVLYNLPASMRSLPEDVAKTAGMANFVEGTNSWGRVGYGGPCPPRGTHRYFIKLYALDATLNLQPGATKDQLLKAMQGHVLAGGELMGKYSR